MVNTGGEDRILGELIGLARACENNPKTENTDRVITEALAACVPENGISDEVLERILGRIQEEKTAVAPNCAVCACPCGNTAAYDIEQIRNEQGESRTVKLQLLSEICRAAALMGQEEAAAGEQEKCCSLFYKILPMVSYELAMESYVPLLSEIRELNQSMEGEKLP